MRGRAEGPPQEREQPVQRLRGAGRSGASRAQREPWGWEGVHEEVVAPFGFVPLAVLVSRPHAGGSFLALLLDALPSSDFGAQIMWPFSEPPR